MSGERVFSMPDLGEGLEEGEIVAWLVAEGDDVALNQPLVEVETAKATVEIPSPFAGTVRSLHGGIGDALPVGAPLVTFTVEGEEAEETRGPEGAAGAEGPARATPQVRKLARSLGLELTAVRGTGSDGRITAEDVETAAGGKPRPSGEPGPARRDDRRRTIAQNLSVQASIPQVTTFRTVECSALDAFRRERSVSPLPVVIAALCRTTEDHPLLNALWIDDAVATRATVDVGLAVDTERGLVVPVIRAAGSLGIGALAAEITRLGTSAREGTLALDDMGAPTIAVSNTGSYGSEAGTPILSPSTSVTLAIGVIEPRALVVDGAVVARPACTLSCTFDHRVLDGATVGRALNDLVAVLENDVRLGGLPA
jgi:2-oxoisovalerate dehydrogenase E2 component (dihydrolipoyl transacylase)